MHLLNVRIDNVSMGEALEKIREFLNDGRQHYVVTPNPDFLVLAQNDKEFREILNQADLSVPDGIGLILASRFLNHPLKERVAGVDLVERLRNALIGKEKIFLLGGKNGVARIIADGWKKVVGFSEKFDEAVNAINYYQADILLVAGGAPKQEKWIAENLHKIPSIKLAIGVGGAFNLISGKIRRAPIFFQILSIEWLWRLFREPWRWKKNWRSVVIFSFLILKQKILIR